MPHKILFVMRAAAHFTYHETTLTHLVDRGNDVTLLFDPTWNRKGAIDDRAVRGWLASGHRVKVGNALNRTGPWRRPLFVAREMRSYASYCRRPPEHVFYANRWRKYLPAPIRAFAETPLGRAAFRWPVTERLMTIIERLAPPDAAILASLRELTPDCVVVSPANMRHDEEIEYVKAAKGAGIPTVVPVLSWDNLTTKGLLHVRPDIVLAWHEGHVKDARHYHGIPRDQIVVTGSPFFDKWFNANLPVRSRAAMCERLGIDPARPYLVYLGSSANIAKNEAWLVSRFTRALGKSPDAQTRLTQVVFKPHPANLQALERLTKLGIRVWPREYGLPDTLDVFREFRDMLHHAVCAIGVNTTGMVDAVIYGTPCVALVMEQLSNTQSDATHFQRMIAPKGIHVAAGVDRAVTAVRQLLAGNDRRPESRNDCPQLFARPCGLGAEAGEAAARAIELIADSVPAGLIRERLAEALASRPTPARPPVDPEPSPPVEPQARLRPQQPVGATIRAALAQATRDPVYAHYQRVRDLVLAMMDEGSGYDYSAYWAEEAAGFDYLFDASPMIIAKLREHTYHITGLRSYEYRAHHAAKAAPFGAKLDRLRQLDHRGLFVPESPALGGFGHHVNGAVVNRDTLKFYECLIALERASILDTFRDGQRRHRVLEVGAGWGGLAYQFTHLFPNTTYVIVDLPPTLLFSAVYLRAVFPDAHMRIYGDAPLERLFVDDDHADFIFVPAYRIGDLELPSPDLAINVASFQEMTTAQVTGYVTVLADAGCPLVYSLNRDRSPYNEELTAVSDILASRYRTEPIDVLDVPYTVLDGKPRKPREAASTDYRHIVGHLDR